MLLFLTVMGWHYLVTFYAMLSSGKLKGERCACQLTRDYILNIFLNKQLNKENVLAYLLSLWLIKAVKF